jgi:hypothetical protein
MSRRPAVHTKATMERAASVAVKFGMAVEFLADGGVRFSPADAAGKQEPQETISAFDEWKAKHDARSSQGN